MLTSISPACSLENSRLAHPIAGEPSFSYFDPQTTCFRIADVGSSYDEGTSCSRSTRPMAPESANALHQTQAAQPPLHRKQLLAKHHHIESPRMCRRLTFAQIPVISCRCCLQTRKEITSRTTSWKLETNTSCKSPLTRPAVPSNGARQQIW